MRNGRSVSALACLGCMLAVATARPCGAAVRKTYDASLGTQPDAQGFELYDDGGSPAYTIQDGALHQGLTNWDGKQKWMSRDTPIDFEVGAVMETEVKIIHSSVSTSGGYRIAGWDMSITDSDGRCFVVYIGSEEIFLWNEPELYPQRITFDSTDDFHHYRLVIADGAGSLFIGGASNPSLTLPVGPAWHSLPNTGQFGDITYHGQSESLLRSFSYINVPEPASLCLLALGGWAVVKCRRKM